MNTNDDRFDQELNDLLKQPHSDTAPLSQAVLTRLSGPVRSAPTEVLEDVLSSPLSSGIWLSALLLAGGVLGYAALPNFDSVTGLVQILTGDLLTVLGGF